MAKRTPCALIFLLLALAVSSCFAGDSRHRQDECEWDDADERPPIDLILELEEHASDWPCFSEDDFQDDDDEDEDDEPCGGNTTEPPAITTPSSPTTTSSKPATSTTTYTTTTASVTTAHPTTTTGSSGGGTGTGGDTGGDGGGGDNVGAIVGGALGGVFGVAGLGAAGVGAGFALWRFLQRQGAAPVPATATGGTEMATMHENALFHPPTDGHTNDLFQSGGAMTTADAV